jgi:MoxR-like ATPase
MAEKQVTIGDCTHPLPTPFLVLATQNPLEQEGTYPLPEAQMDRFLFKLLVVYPSKDEEMEILNSMSIDELPTISPVIDREQIVKARDIVNKIYLDEKLKEYIVEIVLATREPAQYGLAHLEDIIEVGCSPRATISLTRASRAQAFISGRGYVTADDVKAIANPVLRHRLILSYEAEAENMGGDDVVREIFSHIEVPR